MEDEDQDWTFLLLLVKENVEDEGSFGVLRCLG